ncbi:hypothetical protein MMC26_002631 [Xylographa opegraphella]|nr:hypothetical protein [Xylographa opegraphella]
MASIAQILAFSTKKINNGPFFRWEAQNGGLEHKCAICHTCLSSPRAKKSCFGIHEFICPGYHGTLHRAGSEHKCDACRMASEQHIDRIREIATVDYSAQERIAEKPMNPPSRKRGSIARGAWDPINGSSMKPPDSPGIGASPGTAVGANKKDKKAEQSARRARAHTGRLVSAEEVARWEAALHPPVPERSDTDAATAAAALTYTPQLSSHSSIKQDAQAKKALRRRTLHPAALSATKAAIVDALLAKLDIGDTTPRYAGKEGRALMGKLRGLIEAHLTVSANEERYRMQRMEGYWRYVNRRAYNRMVRGGELWDCGTGGMLPEIEESEGGEEGGEEGVEVGGGRGEV